MKQKKSIGFKMMAAGVVLLAVVLTVMMSFFGLLEHGMHIFAKRATTTFTKQMVREAETIARLIAFEMSSVDGVAGDWAQDMNDPLNLCENQSWDRLTPETNQNLSNLLRILWEKVNFNESINSVELIHAGEKDGKYLTIHYSSSEQGSCPSREWRRVNDPVQSRRIKDLMDVNRQKKAAGDEPEKLLEPINDEAGQRIIYFMPLYVPVAVIGAQFVGVVKVDINAAILFHFVNEQITQVENVQRNVVIWVLVGLVVSLTVGFWLFNFVTKKITEPIKQLTHLAESFSAGQERDLGKLAANLRRIPIQSEDEVFVLRDAFVELAEELNQHVVRLVDGQRLMGLGTLAQGIAHEIFSPLTYVQGNLPILRGHVEALIKVMDAYEKLNLPDDSRKRIEGLKKKMKLDKRLKFLPPLLNDLDEGTDRMYHIVQSLRDFAGFQHEDEPTYDVHGGLDSTLNLLRNRFKKGVTVHKDYGELPPIKCQGRRVNQVFMNILKNAGDAIDDQGDIWIKTSSTDHHVLIAITDDGEGVKPETVDKLFQPFFTTKSVEKGTGLGLSISKSIIEDNQGSIWVENTPPPRGHVLHSTAYTEG